MDMKRMLLGLTIMVAVMAGIQGAAFAAETGDQLWLRIMTRECIREMVETGVGAEDAAMYANQYQFMAMSMKGQTETEEETEAERIGGVLGMVLGTALAQQGPDAMTDAAFAFMSAVRAGMAPETAATAEVQLLMNRYTIRNVFRIMTRATEMMRTMQSVDDGEAIAEMIRTMAQNSIATETMIQTMTQSGQASAETAGSGSGNGTAAGAGSGAGSGSGSGGSGNGSGQGSGSGN